MWSDIHNIHFNEQVSHSHVRLGCGQMNCMNVHEYSLMHKFIDLL